MDRTDERIDADAGPANLRRGPMRRLLPLLALATLAACSEGGDESALPELAERGKHYYQNVCVACHNGDPTLDGVLGPAIAGSSLALIEAKVMRAEYPAGYIPKRATAAMPRFEYLKDEIDSLAAYLAQVAQAPGPTK